MQLYRGKKRSERPFYLEIFKGNTMIKKVSTGPVGSSQRDKLDDHLDLIEKWNTEINGGLLTAFSVQRDYRNRLMRICYAHDNARHPEEDNLHLIERSFDPDNPRPIMKGDEVKVPSERGEKKRHGLVVNVGGDLCLVQMVGDLSNRLRSVHLERLELIPPLPNRLPRPQ